MRPSKMTGQLVPVKPPPRPTTGPTKKPSPPRPTTGPTKKPSPPRPTTGPTKKPSPPRPLVGPTTTGFKGAFQHKPPVRPTTGPAVKPTQQWSTYDNISLNDIRRYAQQYRGKSSQDIYKILITKCNPHDSKKNVCQYDVEILSRIIHSYPLHSKVTPLPSNKGRAPNAPQITRAQTPAQKGLDKKFTDLLRHITHDYDLVYKYKDIPVEQMLKRVNELKTRLDEFKHASNDAKNSTIYKQRNAEYVILYKYIDTNKKLLNTLIFMKSKAAQLAKNPTNAALAHQCAVLYKQTLDLNNSIPTQYRLLPHLNLDFILKGLVRNPLYTNDPILRQLAKETFKKFK
jgi:mRNA-degrading endonuclease RelE of RelBE toxin-antitoxin system